jgi:ABC-type antimicrobial peptide transport system permease subunit
VQQQVAQLLADVCHILFGERIHQLKTLLDGVVAQRLESLLAIPRALLAQVVHHLKQTSQSG